MKKKSLWTIIILAILAILFFSGVGLEIVSAIYDVTGDGVVDFEDAALTWFHRAPNEPYEALYDVNSDSSVDFQDAALVWYNIGTVGEGDTILDWLADLIWS